MSWFVLQCRIGQEKKIIQSCRQHLSACVLDAAFSFHCERLWRAGGIWNMTEKEMFPGYIFLESKQPQKLSKELEQYRNIIKVMEEPGYLISVYEEEEKNLRELCGENHCLKMSYGYKENGINRITEGPLMRMKKCIVQLNWHRRFAQVEIPVAKRKTIIWAGLEFDERVAGVKKNPLVS